MSTFTKHGHRVATANQHQLSKQRHLIGALVLLAGSQQALANQLGVTQAAVSKWRIKGWHPLKRAVAVEALYGVPCKLITHPRIVSLLESAEALVPNWAEV